MNKRAKGEAKGKRSNKRLLNERAKRKKKLKKGKSKESVKALKKRIKRLTGELEAKEEEIKSLKGRQDAEPVSGAEVDDPSGLSDDWSGTGSISDRKKMWERHQYLRARYEHHLEAGLDKSRARIDADNDLRERYGEEAGYTREQLEGILT